MPELLRSDVRALKVAIITEVMGFTEAEDKAFWPIYREYDREMAKLGDERVAMIAEYASNYFEANRCDRRETRQPALDLEARRQAVKAKWCKPTRGRALAADSPARPPGRAPAVAADRSADRGCAAHRPVKKKARDEYSNRPIGCRGSSPPAPRSPRTGSGLRSGKVVEGMFIGGDSKRVRLLSTAAACPRFGSRTR